jgi:starvation-inducible DNA-binding protein
MKTSNITGLDTGRSKEITVRLNSLLANYTIFYMNVRGFHWNIRGSQFFELHKKFEELYSDIEGKIDEIAERILTLGHTPVHTFSDYLRIAEIRECHDVTTANETVSRVLEGLSSLIRMQRELLSITAEADDQGTNALMSDYIREHEKLCWMFNAFLHPAGLQERPSQQGQTGSGMSK